MNRDIVYCSACKNYYEKKGGQLYKINENELTTNEKILCTRPAYDLSSWHNNQQSCGCKKSTGSTKGIFGGFF